MNSDNYLSGRCLLTGIIVGYVNVRYQERLDMLKNLIASKVEELKNDPSSPVYRIIGGVLVSLIFSSYPIFIFLIYMWKNGFYSYDVIGEGFSLSIFFYANLMLLIVISLFMLGSITTTSLSWKSYIKKSYTKKRALIDAIKSNAVFIFINFLALVAIIVSAWKAENKEIYVFLVVVSITIVFLITSLAVGTARFYFKAVVLVTGIMYALPLVKPDEASILLADGLRFFGAGNRSVSLTSTDHQAPFEMNGSLVFLSPDYVYIKGEEDESLVVIPRRDSLNIKYLQEKKSNKPIRQTADTSAD